MFTFNILLLINIINNNHDRNLKIISNDRQVGKFICKNWSPKIIFLWKYILRYVLFFSNWIYSQKRNKVQKNKYVITRRKLYFSHSNQLIVLNVFTGYPKLSLLFWQSHLWSTTGLKFTTVIRVIAYTETISDIWLIALILNGI